jgi:glycosyltransferase involved in cell wall biosynthesis
MKITVVISYYKALANLKIILQSLNNQSNMNFDVILSEDDSNEETLDFLNKHRADYSFNIIHNDQKEDNGFRKNLMLNRAINTCQTDYMAFIDGDCVPHRHFVKQYIKNFKKDFFFIGRAAMMSKELSTAVKKEDSLSKLNFSSIASSNSEHIKDGLYFPFFKLAFKTRGLVGRNWGVHKQHLIDINGFDNDYIFAGVGEDVDIEWRLLANGTKGKSIKNKAIVFHIYHEKGYSEVNVAKNYKILEKKQEEGNVACLNGFKQTTRFE